MKERLVKIVERAIYENVFIVIRWAGDFRHEVQKFFYGAADSLFSGPIQIAVTLLLRYASLSRIRVLP